MTSSKCLAIRWRSLTRPTRTPMAAASRERAPRHARPRCARGPPRWPPAAPRACAPAPPASTGLRHTTRRSPGKSGLAISTRSRSSNSDSWRMPSATRPLMAGARRALTQSMPPISRRRAMRARGEHPPVAHEHEPAPRPKRSRSFTSWASSVAGSAVLPAEGLHRHRAAVGVGQQAEHDLGPVGPVVPAVAVGRERAAAALDPGGGDVEQHQRRRARGGGARAPARPPAGARSSQSSAPYSSSSVAPSTPSSAASVVAPRPRAVASLDAGARMRATMSATARSRIRDGAPVEDPLEAQAPGASRGPPPRGRGAGCAGCAGRHPTRAPASRPAAPAPGRRSRPAAGRSARRACGA